MSVVLFVFVYCHLGAVGQDELQTAPPRSGQQEHGKNQSATSVINDSGSNDSGSNEAGSQRERDSSKQTRHWKVCSKDDYENRDNIGDRYTTARGHDDSWIVRDGVLLGKQTQEDHGAVIRTALDFDDVDIQFDFRFEGGKSFNFVIDDANEQSVHAGHICRASISPSRLKISDDKTGAMNLEVRKQRQNVNRSPATARALQDLLERTSASAPITINPDQWHSLRIRIRRDVMQAFLDDELVTSLKSPGFAHPTKTKFGFTVNGQSIAFDNLVVRQLQLQQPTAVEIEGSSSGQNRLTDDATLLREHDDAPDSSTSISQDGEKYSSAPDLKISFGPVARKSIFDSKIWSHWGGSVVQADDGRFHLFYSRWPKKLGWSWVTDSEIAHAVASSPFGPYEHQDIALPRRGKQHWDGWCTHNPTIHKFDSKYYLYHMGNTGDGEIVGSPGKPLLNWLHRNNQRIGVAVADHPSGPWTRLDSPILDVSDDAAPDSLMTSNPSVCQRPDGKILMVYKAVGKEFPMPNGGPVVHMVAIGDSPTGPFNKMPDPVFTFEGERFPAEDPYIWYQGGKYRAIVKRIKHKGKKRVFSLVHYDSENGIDWKPAKHHEVSDRTITWEDGVTEQLDHLERPQVVMKDGKPIALICAADRIDENNIRQSFNLQIPLIVEVQ